MALDNYIETKDARLLWTSEEDEILKKGGPELELLRKYRGNQVETRRKYLGLAWSSFIINLLLFTLKKFNKIILSNSSFNFLIFEDMLYFILITINLSKKYFIYLSLNMKDNYCEDEKTNDKSYQNWKESV